VSIPDLGTRLCDGNLRKQRNGVTVDGGEYFPVVSVPPPPAQHHGVSSVEGGVLRSTDQPAGYLFVKCHLEPLSSRSGDECIGEQLPQKTVVKKGTLAVEKLGSDSGVVLSRSVVERRPSPRKKIVESVPVAGKPKICVIILSFLLFLKEFLHVYETYS
jgi:hypothetical protein